MVAYYSVVWMCCNLFNSSIIDRHSNLFQLYFNHILFQIMKNLVHASQFKLVLQVYLPGWCWLLELIDSFLSSVLDWVLQKWSLRWAFLWNGLLSPQPRKNPWESGEEGQERRPGQVQYLANQLGNDFGLIWQGSYGDSTGPSCACPDQGKMPLPSNIVWAIQRDINP